MSAECPVCGHDLPFEGDCQWCALRARIAELEATLVQQAFLIQSYLDELEV